MKTMDLSEGFEIGSKKQADLKVYWEGVFAAESVTLSDLDEALDRASEGLT